MKKRLFTIFITMVFAVSTLLSGCGRNDYSEVDIDELDELAEFDQQEYDDEYYDYGDEFWPEIYEAIFVQSDSKISDDVAYFTSVDVVKNLPESYDLRDYGYVTPVRSQGEFRTCWAFGTSAAAETSILSSMGLSAKEFEETYGVPATLSTRHLGYFSQKHLPTADDPDYRCYNNQDGEGFYFTGNEPNIEFAGNFLMGAITTYACGAGPVLEADFPYYPDEYANRADFFDDLADGKVKWNEPDWSIDEIYRFKRNFELIDANLLPTPTYKYYDENDELQYEYRDIATQIIKSEIYNGRGVAISYKADEATPGQEADYSFMNVAGPNPKYAQYVDDPEAHSDHDVCIVGYDDNYSVDNFLPNHRPPHDGAFICKNSWGGTDAVDILDYEEWGYEGSGYFYLSYYDMSISSAYSYSFDPRIIKGTDYDIFIDGYDFLSSFSDINSIRIDDQVKMANVYVADSDMDLTSVSVLTNGYNSEVTYTVYALNDESEHPEDGEVLATMSIEYDYPGYHRTEFTKPIFLEEGTAYAIVEEIIDHTSEGKKYEIVMNCVDADLEKATKDNPEGGTSVSIINYGESYIYYNGLWKDEVDLINEMIEYFDGIEYIYDNFPIKGYIDVR